MASSQALHPCAVYTIYSKSPYEHGFYFHPADPWTENIGLEKYLSKQNFAVTVKTFTCAFIVILGRTVFNENKIKP